MYSTPSGIIIAPEYDLSQPMTDRQSSEKISTLSILFDFKGYWTITQIFNLYD